jgi:glycosyltransferase involved in cell wall biosynthesis
MVFISCWITLFLMFVSYPSETEERYFTKTRRDVASGPLIDISKIVDTSSGEIRAVAIMNPDWSGVRHATESFGLPNFYTTSFDEDWAASMIKSLVNYKTQVVLFGGIPDGTVRLSKWIKEALPYVKVAVIYHGSPALHSHITEVTPFDSVMEGIYEGHVDDFAVIKASFADTLSTFLHKKINVISNFAPVLQWSSVLIGPRRNSVDSLIHIGVLGNSTPNKNVITQIVAACSVGENVVIHVLRENDHKAGYLKYCQAKIIWYDRLHHNMFVSLLSQMDINMYISFSECQPMIALESMAAGVPVLLSDTTNIFIDNEKLLQYMVCPQQDQPDEILKCLKNLIGALKTKIITAEDVYNHVTYLNLKAEKLLNNLLGGRPIKLHVQEAEDVPSCQDLQEGAPHDQWYSDPTGEVKGRTHVFCTYEIGGVAPGGVGTFIDATIRILLAEGVNIIVLFESMPVPEMEVWRAKVLKELNDKDIPSSATLQVFHLSALVEEDSNIRPTVFWTKAVQWERGLVRLYENHRFDSVEMHEYAGPSTEIFLRRMEGLETLPTSVKVIVRVHGSLTHIAVADQEVYTPTYYLLGAMERFVIASADVVMYPSIELRDFYEETLSISSKRVVLGSPPMEPVIKLGATIKQFDASKNTNILVWGKLQVVKGVFLIAKALVMLFDQYPMMESQITFVGINLGNTKENMLLSIPKKYHSRFHFTGPMDRSKLPDLVTQFRVAVHASKFESFCLAAHEIHQLGMPMIVPDIGVFRVFPPEASMRFIPNDADSLASVIHRVLSDDELVQSMQKAPRITYEDPTTGYRSLFAIPKSNSQKSVILKPACELRQNLQGSLLMYNEGKWWN